MTLAEQNKVCALAILCQLMLTDRISSGQLLEAIDRHISMRR